MLNPELVNLDEESDEESIEVYCRPSPDGCRETRALRRGQQLFARSIPHPDVAVSSVAKICEPCAID